jgi:hypothetical protein
MTEIFNWLFEAAFSSDKFAFDAAINPSLTGLGKNTQMSETGPKRTCQPLRKPAIY